MKVKVVSVVIAFTSIACGHSAEVLSPLRGSDSVKQETIDPGFGPNSDQGPIDPGFNPTPDADQRWFHRWKKFSDSLIDSWEGQGSISGPEDFSQAYTVEIDIGPHANGIGLQREELISDIVATKWMALRMDFGRLVAQLGTGPEIVAKDVQLNENTLKFSLNSGSDQIGLTFSVLEFRWPTGSHGGKVLKISTVLIRDGQEYRSEDRLMNF